MLLSICLITYTILGVYILIIATKVWLNRLFFLILLSISLWCLFYIMQQSSVYRETVIIWFRISTICSLLYFTILLNFYLSLIDNIKFKKVLYALSYLFCLLLVFILIIEPDAKYNFIQINDFWILKNSNKSIWFYIYSIYIVSYISLTVICMFIAGKTTKSNKKKKQFFIHMISLFICLILIITDNFILPLIVGHKSLYFSPLFLLIWALGIWYSIVEYRFLSVTAVVVRENIMNNSDEYVTFIDIEYMIISVNEKMENLLHSTHENLKGQSISEIFFEHESVIRKIENLLDLKMEKVSLKILWKEQNGGKALVDSQISIVRDKFEDIIGFLIYGQGISEKKQLRKVYSVTEREVEVIRLTMQGIPNNQEHLPQ